MKLPSLWILIPAFISRWVLGYPLTLRLFRRWIDESGKDFTEEIAEAAMEAFRFP